MAIYHASVKSFSRGKGHSSTAAAAYRAGIAIADEMTGIRHDYTRRAGVLSVDMLAPKDAPAWANDPVECFNRSEKAETRANARVARELLVALPAELDAEQRRELARDLGQMLVDRYGVGVLVAVHAPDKGGSEKNFHTHLLMTPRQIGPQGLGDRACAEFDARGGAGPAAVRELREATAIRINQHLERAGFSERVDHRSLLDQSRAAEAEGNIGFAATLAREPTKHEGKAVTRMRRRGEHSDRAASNDNIKNANRIEMGEFLRRLEQEGRLMETPEHHTHAAAKRERPSGPGGQLDAIAQPTARVPRPTGGPGRAPALAPSRTVAPRTRTAPKLPQSLMPALARAARRLRTKTGNREADAAMARHEEEMEHLEAEARRVWAKGIDQSLRDSQALVGKLLSPAGRAAEHASKASYRSDMRELREAVKLAARDSSRWDRRLKEERDTRAKLSETQSEIGRWDHEHPKPAWHAGASKRQWAERRRKEREPLEQSHERRAKRLARIREETTPEKQAAYTRQADASIAKLGDIASRMLQRYPIEADKPKPLPDFRPRSSMAPKPGHALTPQEQLDEQDRQRQALAKTKPRGPCLGR